jgi:hypothetical protein
LTAATQAASDKADSAAAVGAQNTASITNLSQVVTDLDSSMASRLEELGAQTDKASGGIQNNAIALITSTLAQVNQRNLLSVQYGDNKASIERVDNVMADASKAVAESLRVLTPVPVETPRMSLICQRRLLTSPRLRYANQFAKGHG